MELFAKREESVVGELFFFAFIDAGQSLDHFHIVHESLGRL